MSEPQKWSVREIDPGAHTFAVRQLIYEERLIVIEADRPVHESYNLIPQMCNDLNAAEEQRHVTGTFRDARGAVPQRRATDEKPEAVIRRMRNGAPRDDDGRQQTAFAEAYLPMDCPACGRARLQVFYDPASSPPFTVECEKCGSTEFDCDEEAHRQGGPHPQTGSASEPQKCPTCGYGESDDHGGPHRCDAQCATEPICPDPFHASIPPSRSESLTFDGRTWVPALSVQPEMERLVEAVDAIDFSDRAALNAPDDEMVIVRRPSRIWKAVANALLDARKKPS